MQHARSPEQAQYASPPVKNHVTSKSPVGDISVVTLIRTDTTLDHSQKAEKVWWNPHARPRNKANPRLACVRMRKKAAVSNMCTTKQDQRHNIKPFKLLRSLAVAHLDPPLYSCYSCSHYAARLHQVALIKHAWHISNTRTTIQ